MVGTGSRFISKLGVVSRRAAGFTLHTAAISYLSGNSPAVAAVVELASGMVPRQYRTATLLALVVAKAMYTEHKDTIRRIMDDYEGKRNGN